MDRWNGRKLKRQIVRQTDCSKDGQLERLTVGNMDSKKDGQMDRWKDRQQTGLTVRATRHLDRCKVKQTDRYLNINLKCPTHKKMNQKV